MPPTAPTAAAPFVNVAESVLEDRAGLKSNKNNTKFDLCVLVVDVGSAHPPRAGGGDHAGYHARTWWLCQMPIFGGVAVPQKHGGFDHSFSRLPNNGCTAQLIWTTENHKKWCIGQLSLLTLAHSLRRLIRRALNVVDAQYCVLAQQNSDFWAVPSVPTSLAQTQLRKERTSIDLGQLLARSHLRRH
jgi:hypothetical protein